MDKHLNNWLDHAEGKKPNTTNNAIAKEYKRQGYKIKNSEYTVKDDNGNDVIFESYIPKNLTDFN